MATDAEVRGKKLDELRRELEGLRAERQKNGEALRLARLEDEAQALLTSEQRAVLNTAGLTDKTDLSVLQARRDALVAQIAALEALIDAVRQVA